MSNSLTNQLQNGTTAAIINQGYETSAGSFSKPFTKFIVSDEHAGYYTGISGINKRSMDVALATEGRYSVIKSYQNHSSGVVNWYDVFVSETNRQIPLYYYMVTGSIAHNDKFHCKANNGIWYDGNIYATSPFSSSAIRTDKYSTVCENEDTGRKTYDYFIVYHGHDAVRFYQR